MMNIIQAALTMDSRKMKPHSIPRMRGAFFSGSRVDEGEVDEGEVPLEAINQAHPGVQIKGCARRSCLLRRMRMREGGGEGEVHRDREFTERRERRWVEHPERQQGRWDGRWDGIKSMWGGLRVERFIR
jgi:hypothetical protein